MSKKEMFVGKEKPPFDMDAPFGIHITIGSLVNLPRVTIFMSIEEATDIRDRLIELLKDEEKEE
jgi:hypothetical protein